MTVKELKEKLNEFDDDMEVVDYLAAPVDSVKIYVDESYIEKCMIA